MIFYYKAYDSDYSSLISELDVPFLRFSVRDNMERENDIILIHIILNISKTESLYKKKDIENLIWNKILSKIKEDSEGKYLTTENNKFIEECRYGYKELFNYCWKQKFSSNKDGKDLKEIYKIVYSNRPWNNKLYNNNYILALFMVLFLYIQANVGDLYWALEFKDDSWMKNTAIMLCVMFTALIPCAKGKRIYFWPLVCMCLLFFIIILVLFDGVEVDINHLYLEEYIRIAYMKKLFINGLMFFLWYPLIILNRERLEDYAII